MKRMFSMRKKNKSKFGYVAFDLKTRIDLTP